MQAYVWDVILCLAVPLLSLPGVEHMPLFLGLRVAVTLLAVGRLSTRRNAKFSGWLLLILYGHLLLSLTFSDLLPGRGGDFYRCLSREDYFRDCVNLCPFATMRRIYWNGVRQGRVSIAYLCRNVGGNLLLFLPLPLLLCRIFPRLCRHRVWLFLVVLAAVGLVEGMQMLLRCGSMDVDDAILNLLGALPAILWAKPPGENSFANRGNSHSVYK